MRWGSGDNGQDREGEQTINWNESIAKHDPFFLRCHIFSVGNFCTCCARRGARRCRRQLTLVAHVHHSLVGLRDAQCRHQTRLHAECRARSYWSSMCSANHDRPRSQIVVTTDSYRLCTLCVVGIVVEHEFGCPEGVASRRVRSARLHRVLQRYLRLFRVAMAVAALIRCSLD